MQTYFVKIKTPEGYFILDDGDAHHFINVMRYTSGKIVKIVYDNKKYLASTKVLFPNIVLKPISEIEHDSELKIHIKLLIGSCQNKKMSLIIQKATELGVSEIIPVKSSRSYIVYDQKIDDKKKSRWEKIAKEAAEQSGRIKIPEINNHIPFKKEEINKYLSEHNLLCYEEMAGKNNNLVSIPKGLKTISIFIGPEGGFEQKEVILLEELGFKKCGLGQRILRVETAVFFIMSLISYMYN